MLETRWDALGSEYGTGGRSDECLKHSSVLWGCFTHFWRDVLLLNLLQPPWVSTAAPGSRVLARRARSQQMLVEEVRAADELRLAAHARMEATARCRIVNKREHKATRGSAQPTRRRSKHVKNFMKQVAAFLRISMNS